MTEKEVGMNYKDLGYNFQGFKNKEKENENEAITGTKKRQEKNLVGLDDEKQQ